MKFDALCMESSRVKQIKDKIHYYVSQLNITVILYNNIVYYS